MLQSATSCQRVLSSSWYELSWHVFSFGEDCFNSSSYGWKHTKGESHFTKKGDV